MPIDSNDMQSSTGPASGPDPNKAGGPVETPDGAAGPSKTGAGSDQKQPGAGGVETPDQKTGGPKAGADGGGGGGGASGVGGPSGGGGGVQTPGQGPNTVKKGQFPAGAAKGGPEGDDQQADEEEEQEEEPDEPVETPKTKGPPPPKAPPKKEPPPPKKASPGKAAGQSKRSQQFRPIAIGTPLGEDVLLLRGFSGTEPLGRMFSYHLDLVSEKHDIKFDDIVGQNVTIRVQASPSETPRYFNGYISSFSHVRTAIGVSEYSATMVPWIWFLTRLADCRIFQQKKVPEIIKQVLQDHGYTDVEDRLKGTYRQWEYCVQYRETHFNFISRLMEEEGVYYYFKHENGKHTLVLADDSTAHETVPSYDEIQYRPPTRSMREKEYITEWCVRQEVQPKTYTHTNFDFKLPRTSLVTTSKSSHQVPDFEIFDYPGEHENTGDGDNYARRRMEEMHADFLTASGTSDCRGIATGYMFTLTEYPRQDQNQQYLVTSTHIDARNDEFNSGTGQEANYTCTFTVIVATEPFRSARITPKPMIRGPQTAIVVGKAGEEIWTDEHGRVKVQFHWDRYSNADENSSCWIRVAQLWAGKKWGGMYIPRIGHEVIVEFLEGDPDRPIVTGRVYNGEEKPPYELPANATRSTIKSNSSKGSDGFNEFRFEDKKGQEQVFLHAEKDMDTRVKNDSRVLIIHDSHEIVGSEDGGKKGDRMEMVYRDKHVKVHRNQAQHIGGDMQLMVGGIDGPGNQDIVIKATKKELIEADEHHHVKGNLNEKVDTNQSLNVGSNLQEKVGQNYAMEAGMAIHVKGGMTVVIEAGTQLTLKVGGNFVDINPAGVFIQGTLVNINSGGAAGSGSGSSPTAPQDAKEAAPTEPAVADDAKAGGMVEPPKPTPPKKVGWYKSQTVPGMQGSQEEQETAQKRIEFQLLDPNGDPMPDERFEVKMPDGSTRSGKTDSEGKLRYDNVQGENPAEIRFPDLGDDEWKRIGADDLTQ